MTDDQKRHLGLALMGVGAALLGLSRFVLYFKESTTHDPPALAMLILTSLGFLLIPFLLIYYVIRSPRKGSRTSITVYSILLFITLFALITGAQWSDILWLIAAYVLLIAGSVVIHRITEDTPT
ncbi:hypothetical protein DGWBC_0031 [Dehalogenimonas sp. WBC-2]|nr:hypothetical protein DGWBC_0031 [Dehalogenimonas sp. WBC-2]